MCLQVLDKEIKYKPGIGYKVFRRDDAGIIKTAVQGFIMEVGVEYKEPKPERAIWNSDGNFGYPSGFHIFPDLEDARWYCCTNEVIFAVKYDNVVATGRDGPRPCIVAQTITVLHRENKR